VIRASTLALALALALGFAAAPAIASPPGATPSKTPARANCGTAWTGWTEDPNTDLNPCPKNCERGERQMVKTYKQGDKTLHSARYQCYRGAAGTPAITTARLVVNGLRLRSITTAPLQMSGVTPKNITTGALRMSGPAPRDIATAPLVMSGKH
jgi:hypothetical protein